MNDHKRDRGREDTELENMPDGNGDTRNSDEGNIPQEFVSSGAERAGDKGDKKTLSEEDLASTKGGTFDEAMSEEHVLSEAKTIRGEIEQRKKEYQELYDRYVRLVADFENYKKRISKEKTDIMAYGNEELIKEILSVIDNLERAIKHSESADDGGSITEGVKLVHRQLLNSLEKFGVKSINTGKGDKFDPRYHQAVEHLVSNEITPGLVISEMLRGYTLKDKLLRPSIVVVSKAEEKEGKEADNSD